MTILLRFVVEGTESSDDNTPEDIYLGVSDPSDQPDCRIELNSSNPSILIAKGSVDVANGT